MTDQVPGISAVSLIPLPRHQSIEAAHDPLPIDSKLSNDKEIGKRTDKKVDVSNRDFADYLNDTRRLFAGKPSTNVFFDPISELERASVYLQPGLRQVL